MSAAQDTVHEYLRERFAHIFIDPDDGEVAVPLGAPGGTVWLRARVLESRDLVRVSSYFPVNTPPYRFSAMSEYLLRCSERLLSGGFKLGFDDGDVCFRTSQFYDGTVLEKEHVSHLVEANLATLRHAAAGILAVAYGGMEPKDAVDLPAWPERLLEEELTEALDEILGFESATTSAPAHAEGAVTPAEGADHADTPTLADDRAHMLACLHSLLQQRVSAAGEDAGEASGAVDEVDSLTAAAADPPSEDEVEPPTEDEAAA